MFLFESEKKIHSYRPLVILNFHDWYINQVFHVSIKFMNVIGSKMWYLLLRTNLHAGALRNDGDKDPLC